MGELHPIIVNPHTPPPGLAFGEPDDRLQRSIQYAATFRFYHNCPGIPDHLLLRMMTARVRRRKGTTPSPSSLASTPFTTRAQPLTLRSAIATRRTKAKSYWRRRICWWTRFIILAKDYRTIL